MKPRRRDGRQPKDTRRRFRRACYGAGIHVCPGAPLARLELRVFAEELLLHTSELRSDPDRESSYAAPPKGGFERVYVRAKRGTKKGRA